MGLWYRCLQLMATDPVAPMRAREFRPRLLAWPSWRLASSLGFCIWLGTRLGMAMQTYATMIFVAPLGHADAPLQPRGAQVMTLLSHWLNWDSGWYVGIAMRGYDWSGVKNPFVFDPLQATSFFPLYPFLVRELAEGLRHLPTPAYGNLVAYPFGISALIVSNLSALVAFVAVAALALQEGYGRNRVQLTLLLLAAYPLAFYLAAGYSEAPMLAASALTLLFARRGQWVGTGVAAALAALTRGPGVLILVPVAWEYGRQHGWWSLSEWRTVPIGRRVRDLAVALPVLFAAPLGTLVYAGYLWRRFGDPLLFLESEHWWRRHLAPPWEVVRMVVQALHHAPPTVGGRGWQIVILLNCSVLLSFIVITIVSARSLPVSFTLYSAGVILLGAVTVSTADPDPLTSAGRYLVPAFPVFLGLANLVRNRAGLRVGLVSGGFFLQCSFIAVWLSGNFVD